MIDFIIVEEDLFYLSKYKKIIDKVMMNYDIEYQLTVYNEYSPKVKELLSKETFKIYVLNIPGKQLLEMIQTIREELDDWQSLIIVFYNTLEEKQKIENKRLFIMDYIEKHKNFDHLLKRDIQICLKNYDQRPNTLKYSYKRVLYNIEYWKILYIEKEPEEKRCKIETIEGSYYIQGCLCKLENKLDKRFLKCNRSYIINLEQVESYDPKSNILTFRNQKVLNVVSREKKKDILNYLRGIE